MASLKGDNEVKQVIPTKGKFYKISAVVGEDGKETNESWCDEIEFLALTYSGTVLPLALADGYFDIDENACIVTEEELKNYNIKK